MSSHEVPMSHFLRHNKAFYYFSAYLTTFKYAPYPASANCRRAPLFEPEWDMDAIEPTTYFRFLELLPLQSLRRLSFTSKNNYRLCADRRGIDVHALFNGMRTTHLTACDSHGSLSVHLSQSLDQDIGKLFKIKTFVNRSDRLSDLEAVNQTYETLITGPVDGGVIRLHPGVRNLKYRMPSASAVHVERLTGIDGSRLENVQVDVECSMTRSTADRLMGELGQWAATHSIQAVNVYLFLDSDDGRGRNHEVRLHDGRWLVLSEFLSRFTTDFSFFS